MEFKDADLMVPRENFRNFQPIDIGKVETKKSKVYFKNRESLVDVDIYEMDFDDDNENDEYNVRSRNNPSVNVKSSLPYSYDENMSISDRQIPQEIGKGRME